MKVKVEVAERCYHPATGLELVPGDMDVTPEQARTLIAAGLAVSVKDSARSAGEPGKLPKGKVG